MALSLAIGKRRWPRYIVAIRGTVKQAVMLGLAATLSHTAVVWRVAMVGMHLGQGLDFKEHDHGYSHDHAELGGLNLLAHGYQDAHEKAHANDIRKRFTNRQVSNGPDYRKLFICHDYPPAGREASWMTTVAEQRQANIHVNNATDMASFVRMRTTRDTTLSVPALLLPAIQVNIRAGNLPPADESGLCSLKMLVNRC